MNIKKVTAIALLLATALFAQAMFAVNHVHLGVVDEQECVICGSSINHALLSVTAVPEVVPAESHLITLTIQASHLRTVVDLRSRAPPISLDS